MRRKKQEEEEISRAKIHARSHTHACMKEGKTDPSNCWPTLKITAPKLALSVLDHSLQNQEMRR